MAWFGDSLSGLSQLKGQITNFTKEVLSEGIVKEIDDQTLQLKEANERCIKLQELLDTKDAEISMLRRQNCELQKIVVELDTKTKESTENQEEEGDVFFWDPPSVKNRNSKYQNHARQLQEQLAQATMRIRELEAELKRTQKVNNNASIMDELPDGHQKAEYLRAKQDMVNRIVRMEEKNREVERNVKRMQEDEIALVNDFNRVISKLDYQEKVKLFREVLRNLENDKQKSSLIEKEEKSDYVEKLDKSSENNESENLKLDSKEWIQDGSMSNREAELSRKILELQNENKNLNVSMEELDRQHAQFIEELLTLKKENEKKHQCLQNAYEQLYVEHNQAEGKVLELQNKLSSMETNKWKKHLEKAEKNVQTEEEESEDMRKKEGINDGNNSLYEFERRVKEILKNSCIETSDSNESIFEIVAKRYVEANWKKDVLERKVTEITRNLKESTEMRDNLQLECDDMQAHIDSLLLDIQHLKLNLPSIPEASEERVASLETETESLQEEIKQLRQENDTLRRLNVIESIPRFENGPLLIHSKENFFDERAVVRLAENNEYSNILKREEDSVEDLKRRLLEFSNETSELRTSLEKYKETIEELRLGKENIAHELKASVCSMEELERELKVTLDIKNELERENSDLIKENEEYQADLVRLKATADDSKKEENDLLEQLRERLEKVSIERNDLEYDLFNMRKELDNALHEANVRQDSIARLTQDNEKFVKENASLLDQLTATQVESQEKIELLNTEKSLLEEEQSELRLEITKHEITNRSIKSQLEIAKEKIDELRAENIVLDGKLEKISELEEKFKEKEAAAAANELLQNEFIETEAELNNNLRLQEKEIAEKELNLLRSRLMESESELNNLRLKEKEFHQAQADHSKEIAVLRDTITDLNDQIRLYEEKYRHLESSFLLSLASETEKNMSVKENSFAKERQKFADSLEEKSQENEELKDINNKLTTEIAEMKNQLESIVESNKENVSMAKETIESLSNLIKEKDNEIDSLKMKDHRAKAVDSNDFLTLKNERDELVRLVQIKHNESLQYHGEIQRLTQLLNEQVSQARNLSMEQNRMANLLKDKDEELTEARNELKIIELERLENIQDKGDDKGEICRIASHLIQLQEMDILKDKCNALEAALIQEQSNNRMLQNQYDESQSKLINSAKEIDRLRTHLITIENSYTEETLRVEDMRKELEIKLLQTEEKLKNSSTVYTSASVRANQEIETLQQQMSLIVQQRDDIQNKLSMAEDKVLSQTAALTNLQIVLEQFQREKERDIKRVTDKLQLQLRESHKKQDELFNEISSLKEQLVEAQECLQAASRLSEQLDKKTERIDQLNREVERLMEMENTADRRIEEAMQSGVGKVDKNLIKNLLLGYLSSSAADKSSVLRVVATVLDFTENDRDKAGINNVVANSGWFSRFGGTGTPTKDQEASLSAAFVRFLESESKPKPQLPALPISSSSSPRPTHSRQHSTSSNHSTLLLSNVTLPTFPDFVPARNTGSILKEVLKDS